MASASHVSRSGRRPVVGIPCDRRMMGPHPFSMAGEKYIDAIAGGADCLPLLIPTLPAALDPAEVLGAVDGLLFTGSPSNVDPALYGGPPPRAGNLADPERDLLTLPLIRAALETGVPSLFICRGHQELNVALGGSLHAFIHELPGRIDHREDKDAALAVQYGPAHAIEIAAGGAWDRMLADAGIEPRRFLVNSLHSQAIDRLAEGLEIEARAEDGTIEAVRVTGARAFALSAQWHPEWRFREDRVSTALFAAFGRAVRQRP